MTNGKNQPRGALGPFIIRYSHGVSIETAAISRWLSQRTNGIALAVSAVFHFL
jgi:hypothetical protein